MDNTFVAIDFETANRKPSSPCALGLIVCRDGIMEKKSWLIKPDPLYFSPFNVSIHGITSLDVKDSPGFDEVWPEIRLWLENFPVIAHNASFDMGVLRYTLAHYELTCPPLQYFCTVRLARKALPHLMNHKLNTVASAIGVDFVHHDALEDAYAASRIVLYLMDKYRAASLQELAQLLNVGGKTLDGISPFSAC